MDFDDSELQTTPPTTAVCSDTQTNTHVFSHFLPPVGHGGPPRFVATNPSHGVQPKCTMNTNGISSMSGAMPQVSLQGAQPSVTCTQSSNISQHFITNGVPSMSGLLSNGVVPQSSLQVVQPSLASTQSNNFTQHQGMTNGIPSMSGIMPQSFSQGVQPSLTLNNGIPSTVSSQSVSSHGSNIPHQNMSNLLHGLQPTLPMTQDMGAAILYQL